MRWGLFTLVLLHGLIHFMGFAKAFELAELPELTKHISRSLGVVWLAAGVAMLATAVCFIYASRIGWMVGLVAVILSQIAIFSSWNDAKFGTLANIVLLAATVYSFAALGPLSFQSEYTREVRKRLEEKVSLQRITEEDVAPLPEPLHRYLRTAGAIGQYKAHYFKATWKGRIRAKKDDPWMEFTAEQHNFVGEPSRFFLMKAKRGGFPVDVFHAYQDDSATMRVRLLSLIPLVHASGPELTQAETVTLFNDLCLLAPSALVDPAIRWEMVDERSVRGYFTVGPNTISAVLFFNEAGELIDFISDDRLTASSDGTKFKQQRWSTPVRNYQNYDNQRAFRFGEGRWHPEEGEYIYLELELIDLKTNHNPKGGQVPDQ